LLVSSPTRIAKHPAYQNIIRIGAAAIPLILSELKRSPDHWFIALREIANEDPVPPSDRGNMKKMSMAWLKWGKERGYLSD